MAPSKKIPPLGEKASYYARECRLAYQQWYNKNHNVGRRHMSRDDKEMKVGWNKRSEMLGFPYYENKMACKARDLEWLPRRMREVEDRERDRLFQIRDDIKAKHGKNPEVWIPIFAGTVRLIIDDILREAHTYRQTFEHPEEGPDATPMVLKGYRRRIAIHHEMIDLLEQGPGEEAFWAAFSKCEMVMQGQR
ncbi:hypothetical protein EIP86_001539 [Pleurotus ostreatoroseus]|nr:hypothetical protein EIP86_001539 [Pleurotus ostreatoroseus]